MVLSLIICGLGVKEKEAEMRGSIKKWKAGRGWKAGAAILFGISVLFLYACAGQQAEVDRAETELSTPEEAVQAAMEALKELDMKAFNACTDNYVCTRRNWLGFPVEKEYRVFNELMHTGWKKGARYEVNYKLAEKSLARLTWEIRDVKQEADRAEVAMEITNIDMTKVLGKYEIYELEYLANGGEFGVGQFVKGMFRLANAAEDLAAIMDTLGEEDVCTVSVTVQVYKEKGCWKVHLGQDFIDAFLGYGGSEKYPLEMQKRIEELTEEIEEGAQEWARQFEDSIQQGIS